MILTKSKIGSIDIDTFVDGKIITGKLNELVLIVPTNRKIRSLKRQIISHTPLQTTGKINLETIGTFATNLLFGNGNSNGRALSEAAAAVLLKQSFLETDLKYFSIYKNEIPHGTLERIRDVISEYKRHGISPSLLKLESESLSGSEKIKAEDIANVFENYQLKFSSLNVKEIGDIYWELCLLSQNEFEINFRKLYPDASWIVINGFDEFTTPEIEIINSASEIKDCELFISFDYYNSNEMIFSHLENCYSKLIKKGFVPVKDTSTAVQNKFQTLTRENLFKPKPVKQDKRSYDSLTKIFALNRENEVRLLAKEIKELIDGKKVEPHNICIIFNLIQKYSPIIRDIFPLYGLPFNLTDRIPLDSSSPVISIVNFLEILENDFYYKNIFRALSGGYLNLQGIDASNLLKASVNLKIISGFDNWVNTIHDAIEKLYDQDEDNNVKDKAVFEKALEDINKIYNLLLPFSKSMTLEEFYSSLQNFIFSLKLPERIINNRSTLTEENVKGLTTFLELVEELFELFELEYSKNKKFQLSFFLNNIRTAVHSSRFNIKEKSGYGIQITTLNEIRGLKFDYIFISGLCDGDLPTRYSPEIFYSGSYSKNERNHQTEERYRFYQSLCAWEKHLYFTYPLQEEKKELVKSNFLNELEEICSINEKQEKDYSNSIYSKEELLIYLAKNNAGSLPADINIDEYGIDLEKIKNSIEINKLRLENPFGGSPYSGHIKEALEAPYDKALKELELNEYSISQLETYAKCPYKFFAERILKLELPEEPSEDIEALELGSLLHSILYRFYKDIRTRGITIANADDERFNFAENLIFEIAEKQLEEVNFNSPLTFYEKEKIMGISGQRKNSILYKFLLEERNNPDGFTPEYFEKGFGSVKDEDKRQRNPIQITIDSVKVSGKIDRIDIDEHNNKFKVIDYKLSGKKPTASELLNGISLQLPLYLYAAKEMIKAQLNKDLDPARAVIYSLKFSDKEFGEQLISQLSSHAKQDDKKVIEAYKELIEISLEMIKKYVQAITEGKFNLSTLKNRENIICRYCNFRPVCRIQEVN